MYYIQVNLHTKRYLDIWMHLLHIAKTSYILKQREYLEASKRQMPDQECWPQRVQTDVLINWSQQ
jgi:hypothetical protein